jgi:decaprenylphospho-beta-D-erythro-pentofuranosid-2-ulose 2-reductase
MEYILILGGTSDIGLAIAHAYARNEYNIYLAGRNLEAVEKNAKDIALRYGVQAEAHGFNLESYSSHPDFYDHLRVKPLGVICAAGYLGDHSKATQDFSEAKSIYERNIIGYVSILNIIGNDFKRRGSGFIVGITSVAGERGRQSNYYYGSAKAAFTEYLSGLRNRLYPSKIQVMTVKAGFVQTKMTEHMHLPGLLTVNPDYVARKVYRCQRRGRNTIFIHWIWRPIMFAIRSIPEFLFKRLKL